MSCMTSQSSFLFLVACSIAKLIIWIGIDVVVFFRTEKLSPVRISWSEQIFEIRLVRILVRSFRPVSIRVIGWVFFKLPLHVSFLGMRIIVDLFHSIGVFCCLMHSFSRLRSIFLIRGGAFFHISFGILDGPGLLFVGRSLTALANSSSLMGSISLSKCFSLISWYRVFHVSFSRFPGCLFLVHCCMVESTRSFTLSSSV